jgi:hypothetical protein
MRLYQPPVFLVVSAHFKRIDRLRSVSRSLVLAIVATVLPYSAIEESIADRLSGASTLQYGLQSQCQTVAAVFELGIHNDK